MSDNEEIIGIDLGTSTTCFALLKNNEVNIIKDYDSKKRKIPSVVCFTEEEEECLVGELAENHMIDYPKSIIFENKRLIGKKYDEIKEYIKRSNVKIINKDNKPQYVINRKGKEEYYYPEDICTKIFEYIKKSIKENENKEIKKTILTVPNCFNEEQRKIMKESAEKAGLEVIKIINESTAAGIAYGCIHKTNKEKIVLIFDLGGGYFNFSILKIKENEFNVLCSEGKENIGGEDFNLKLMDFILPQIKQKFNDLKLEYGENSSNNTLSTLLSIKKQCEKIKNQLSRSNKVKFEINLNGIYLFSTNINVEEYQNLCNELWKDCFKLIEN